MLHRHVERTARAVAVDIPKHHRAGTHRAVPPAETLARLGGMLAPAGITRVANVTGLDRIGIPVVMVCRPNARSLAVAQGKGVDLVSAKVSGIMESLETFHAEYVDLPVVRRSFDALAQAYEVVDVTRLARRSDRAFDTGAVLPWVAGYDLLRRCETWLPLEVVDMNYTRDALAATSGRFALTSTGLASGNNLLEAIGHAIYEILERDALMLWRQSRDPSAASRVALATVEDAGCRELLARYAAAGIQVEAWDVTQDIGVPVHVALIDDATDRSLGGISTAVGVGCHLDAGVALSRALTEAAQTRLTFIAGSRDDLARGIYDQMLDVSRRARTLALAAAGAGEGSGRPLRANRAGDWFGGDLQTCLDALRGVGVDSVIAVDLSRSDFGIHVARVVIPGLECAVFGHDVALPGARVARRQLDQALRSAVARARESEEVPT